MISKTPLGIPFFDAKFGGIYPNRVVLLTGRAGSGKTIFGVHFISQALQHQERALMLSTRPAQDLVIMADSMNISLSLAIESGALTLLEYNEFIPGRDHEASIMLPPDGFIQLKEIIEQQAVSRVVIDSVLPWITLPDATHLPEHIFSLVRAFERLGVTALFTLPKPVSAAAVRVRKYMEDVVPVSLTLLYEQGAPSRQLLVNKYLGLNAAPEGIRFDIVAQKGVVLHEDIVPPPAAKPLAANVAAPVHTAPIVPPPATPPASHAHFSEAMKHPSEKGRTSFASLVLNQPVPPGRPAPAGAGGVAPVWDGADRRSGADRRGGG